MSTTTIPNVFLNGAPLEVEEPDEKTFDHDPFCFVCGRVTDHFAEHDDLVATGEAKYGEDGNVYRLDECDLCGGRETEPWTLRLFRSLDFEGAACPACIARTIEEEGE